MSAVLLASACTALLPAVVWAQAAAAAEERKPLQLAVSLGDPPSMDRELLRMQLERELGVVVVLDETITVAGGATLTIDAPTRQAVHVAFGESERTVDLSSAGAHAVETLALVAANLMRDEASDLLASLRATTPEPLPSEPAGDSAARPPPVAEKPAPQPERSGCQPVPDRYKRVPFGANLVPRVGTSSRYGSDVVQSFSFNLIGGSAAALDGFELAGVFNHESYSVCGAQIAGGVNFVTGPMTGFQLASLNMVDGPVDGGQVAFINTSSGTLHGFQGALLNLALRGGDAVQVGFANIVTGNLAGSQVGFGNLATGTVEGGQFGFGNVTLQGVSGVQIGFANVAQELSGAQAGFVNTAAGESTGLQLGFVNVTSGQSRGLMLGAVNVSEDADAAVGLLNIYTQGRTQLDAWVTDAGIVMVGVEHGGRLLHSVLGVGSTSRSGQGVFAFAYGLGARVHASSSLYVDVDAIGYGLLTGTETEGNPAFGSIMQVRVPIGCRLTRDFSLFVAPSLNISAARNDPDNTLRDPGFYGARVTTNGSSVASYIWPGLSLGARFF